MKDLDAVQKLRSLAQLADEAGVVGREVFKGPEGGGTGHRVEPFQIFEAGAGPIVVAANHHRAMRAHPLDHLVGVGSVPNYIAAADHARIPAFGVIEHRLQRLPVGMEIAYGQVTHGERIQAFVSVNREISGGAPIRAGIPMVPMPGVT